MDEELDRAFRRRLREMETMELVQAWEEPMPASVRALLREEIGRRGYRLRSLPPPREGTSTSIRPLTREAQARSRVRAGAHWLLAAALLQLIEGLWELGRALTSPTAEPTRVVRALVLIALAGMLSWLFRRARRAPRSAVLTAVVLIVGVRTAEALVAPSELERGLLTTGVIVSTLLMALREPGGVLLQGSEDRGEETS